MYLILLLCILQQIHGYGRNQKPTTPFQAPKPALQATKPAPQASKPVSWPKKSDSLLYDMAMDMFGYRLFERQRGYGDQTKEEKALWDRFVENEFSPKLELASIKTINIISIYKLTPTSPVLHTLDQMKTELANIWDELNSEEQMEWKEIFPYAN